MDDALVQTDTQAPRVRRLGGGREAKRAARSARSNQSAPYITRKIPYYEVLDEEGLQLIERNADTILEETGIDFMPMDAVQAHAAAKDLKIHVDAKAPRAATSRANGCISHAGWHASWCRPPRRASSRSTRATRRTTW